MATASSMIVNAADASAAAVITRDRTSPRVNGGPACRRWPVGDATGAVEISASAAGPCQRLLTRGAHGPAAGGERVERPQFDDVAA